MFFPLCERFTVSIELYDLKASATGPSCSLCSSDLLLILFKS